MSEFMIVLLGFVLIILMGYAWDISRVVRRMEFRGLSIAALAVRTIGPVAGYVAYASYDTRGDKFGALSAMAKGIAWSLPFFAGALLLELILIVVLLVARAKRAPISE